MSGSATLPPTDGGTHVRVRLEAVSNAAPVALTLTVTYAATDTSVEVIPPGSASSVTVGYTPESTTTGATVTPVGLVTPAPGYTLVISQAGGIVSHAEACDFLTELSECVGPVTPANWPRCTLPVPADAVVLPPTWK